MENKKHLYEPILNFRKNKPQIQLEIIGDKKSNYMKKPFFLKKKNLRVSMLRILPLGTKSHNSFTEK